MSCIKGAGGLSALSPMPVLTELGWGTCHQCHYGAVCTLCTDEVKELGPQPHVRPLSAGRSWKEQATETVPILWHSRVLWAACLVLLLEELLLAPLAVVAVVVCCAGQDGKLCCLPDS